MQTGGGHATTDVPVAVQPWRIALAMDLEKIEKLTDGLPYMRLAQARKLAERFAEWLPLNILEIGTYHGTGACYFGEMVRERGGQVTTVDLASAPPERSNEIVRARIERCGLDNVTVVKHEIGAEGFMFERLVSGQPPFDFVYIDGGHDMRRAVPQFCLAMVCLRPGGRILFDDIDHPKYPEVRDVWRHVVVHHPGVAETEEVGSWGFVRRI